MGYFQHVYRLGEQRSLRELVGVMAYAFVFSSFQTLFLQSVILWVSGNHGEIFHYHSGMIMLVFENNKMNEDPDWKHVVGLMVFSHSQQANRGILKN